MLVTVVDRMGKGMGFGRRGLEETVEDVLLFYSTVC